MVSQKKKKTKEKGGFSKKKTKEKGYTKEHASLLITNSKQEGQLFKSKE